MPVIGSSGLRLVQGDKGCLRLELARDMSQGEQIKPVSEVLIRGGVGGPVVEVTLIMAASEIAIGGGDIVVPRKNGKNRLTPAAMEQALERVPSC